MSASHPRPLFWATLALLVTLLLLAGCASVPKFDTSQVDRSLTPALVLAQPKAMQGKHVLWGGMIIAATNFPHYTQLEVLGFPLDSDNRPDTARKPQARFLIEKSGYLETVDYAQGRLVTVVGTVAGTRDGKVGQSRYTYPLIRADQLHLWSQGGGSQSRTHFNFGIGVIFH